MRDMDLLPALIRNYNDKLAGLVEDGHPDSSIVLDSSSGIAGAVSVEMLSGYESDVQLCFVARDHVYCIVAHPDCLVTDFLASSALNTYVQRRSLIRQALFVVVAGAAKDAASIIGVWHGDDLEDALAFGSTRSLVRLSGTIAIPEIRRICGHSEAGQLCAAVMTFSQYPDAPPPCPNPSGLTGHTFVW
jgi:hypothetical protein